MYLCYNINNDSVKKCKVGKVGKNMDTRIERIREIEAQRFNLAIERDKLQNEIREENLKKQKEERCLYIGKYFKKKKFAKSESYGNIFAFKILSLDDDKNDYAMCLTLCDGIKNSCWNEKGIINQVMSLWVYDSNRMIHKECDALTIDLFEEITKEEFDKLKNELLNELED